MRACPCGWRGLSRRHGGEGRAARRAHLRESTRSPLKRSRTHPQIGEAKDDVVDIVTTARGRSAQAKTYFGFLLLDPSSAREGIIRLRRYRSYRHTRRGGR